MRFHKLMITVLVSLGVVVLSNSVCPPGGRITPQKSRPAAKHSLPPLAPVPLANNLAAPPVPWVTVAWDLSLNNSDQAVYRKAATTMSAVAQIPPDRNYYYAAIIDDVGSWTGMVTHVQPASDGGHYVTVLVEPVIRSESLFGDATWVTSDYSEIYHVDINNNAKYCGFADPQGLAGLMPSLGVD